MKERIIEDVKEIMRNPNEERCLETSNHISEWMVYSFSKLEAIECVCYWRNKYDELLQKFEDGRRKQNVDSLLSDIPLYRQDPENVDFLIRAIRGKEERVQYNYAKHEFVAVEDLK